MENLKTIITCDNPFIAEVIKQTLAENDISSMVIDQTITGVNGGYGPFPGYAIRVFEKDEARAKDIADDIMANR
ncbi:MAG: DUF2007 domain-containing protein [Prevotella sp.]|nr:DUF2007 domain-containing protein [Prevotella sp.]